MATSNKYLNNKFLKTLEPLNSLSIDKLSEIANKSTIEHIPAGRNLFRQGEKDKQSYYLVSGQIELYTSGEAKPEIIKAKTPEAKYPLVQQSPRPCTAKAKVNSEIISIDTSLLEMLLESDGNPSGHYEVTEINSDDENGWMLKFLQSRAFLQIPTENIQKILMSMTEISAKKGEVIVSQGERNDFYYIVKNGKCSVTRRPSPSAEDIQIAILAAGDGFGEEALITQGQRNASVSMLENGSLMRLSKEDFLSLLVEPLLDYIHIDELKSRATAGDLLVDVRQHKDFMANHLEGAVNTPLSMIRLKLNSFNSERNIIVYCNDASRSTAAAFLLIQNGLSCSILKDGLENSNPAQTANQTDNSMTNIISNLEAVTNKTANAKITQLPNTKQSHSQSNKIKEQIDNLNKQNNKEKAAQKRAAEKAEQLKIQEQKLKEAKTNLKQEAEKRKQALEEKAQLELEKKTLELEKQALRDKAEAERLAAENELKKFTAEADKHKQAIEEKNKAKQEAKSLREKAKADRLAAKALQEKAAVEKLAIETSLQKQVEAETLKHKRIIAEKLEAEQQALALRDQAEAEKLAAEEALQKQTAEAQKHKRIFEEKHRAEVEAQALREQAETEKRFAENALREQKAFAEKQLKLQQERAKESQREMQLESEKIREQANAELLQLREELHKTRNSVKNRVKALKEKEKQEAEEEIRNRQQHANDAIKNSIEKARVQAATEAEKMRQQALLEAQSLQKEIDLKKQKIEAEAERIRLEAERDRAATLELARIQAQEIVTRTIKEAEFINTQRQELDEEAEQMRLNAETEKHATLEAAKIEARNIISKTAEEAQQIDAQRQRIEDEVSKIRAEAEQEKALTLKAANIEANRIRIEAEKNSQQQTQLEIEQVKKKTLQQTKSLEKQRKRLEIQAQKDTELQRVAMEKSLKKADEIRIQAEKEAEQIRLDALQSATESAEEITLKGGVPTATDNESEISYSDINIPAAGISDSSNTSMVESEARSLAQEIVSKLEKAESNRIKEQHHTSNNSGLSLASASLKRRSDGQIVLEGEEDTFIFKEPKTYSDKELSELKEALYDSDINLNKSDFSDKSVKPKTSDTKTKLPDFTIEEPDFDLVDELPSHLSNKQDTAISEFSDFELHQPSDINSHSKSISKRPAQRIIAIAASLFVAIGVGITFLGINSEQTSTANNVAFKGYDSFNATKVSAIATNNVEIDKKVISEAEREFEKLLKKWKRSHDTQLNKDGTTIATEVAQ